MKRNISVLGFGLAAVTAVPPAARLLGPPGVGARDRGDPYGKNRGNYAP